MRKLRSHISKNFIKQSNTNVVVAFLVLLFLSVVSSFTLQADTVDPLYQEAQSAYLNKDYENAKTLYAQYLTEIEPGDLYERITLQIKEIDFRLTINNGNLENARQIAAEIYNSDCSAENRAKSLYLTGTLFESNGYYSDALIQYELIVNEFSETHSAGPDKAEFRLKYFLCRTALVNNDFTSAAQYGEEIKKLDTSTTVKPQQLYATGWIFESKRRYSDALGFYNKILNEYPDSTYAGPGKAAFRARYIQCQNSLESENISTAEQLKDEILLLNSPDHEKPEQLYLLAKLFEENEDYITAVNLYQQLSTEYPQSDQMGPDKAGFHARYTACHLALESGQDREARIIAQEIRGLNSSPKEKPYQLYKTGLLLEKSDLCPDALSCYVKLLSDYPNAIHSGANYAGFHGKYVACKIALQKGNISQAKALANQIRQLDILPERKAAIYYSAGSLFAEKGLFVPSYEEEIINHSLQVMQSFYNDIISFESPESKYYGYAQIYLDAFDVIQSINQKDSQAVEQKISQLKTKHSGDDLTMALFIIAERYYGMGKSGDGEEYLYKSLAIYEQDILADIPNNRLSAASHYMRGLNYRKLKDYAQEAESFMTAYMIDPEFKYAEFCIYMVARVHQGLVHSGTYTSEEAEPAIRQAYELLSENHPQSQYAQIALQWLNQN